MNCLFLRRGYEESGPKFSDTFSENDWATIILACQGNAVPDTWAVGDQKAMTINGTDYPIDIIGKGHDTYSDGSGIAPLTFQLHDCYNTTYAMNSTNTNSGGWKNCAMRSTTLPALLALMPSEVQTAIKEVNKLSSAGTSSSTINTTADKLFLLSEVEIFNSTSYSYGGEGSQYAYYSAGNSKVKKVNGSAKVWWERSPRKNNSNGFAVVSATGTSTYGSASGTAPGLAPAFCF